MTFIEQISHKQFLKFCLFDLEEINEFTGGNEDYIVNESEREYSRGNRVYMVKGI